jgi:hypothetical protein
MVEHTDNGSVVSIILIAFILLVGPLSLVFGADSRDLRKPGRRL